jgi:hypothetical protein
MTLGRAYLTAHQRIQSLKWAIHVDRPGGGRQFTSLSNVIRSIPELGICLVDSNKLQTMSIDARVQTLGQALSLTKGATPNVTRAGLLQCMSKLEQPGRDASKHVVVGGSMICLPSDALIETWRLFAVKPYDWIITRQPIIGDTPKKFFAPIKVGETVRWDERFLVQLSSNDVDMEFYGKALSKTQFTIKPMRKADYHQVLNRLETSLNGTLDQLDPLVKIQRQTQRKYADVLKMAFTDFGRMLSIPCITHFPTNQPAEQHGLMGSSDVILSIPSFNVSLHPGFQATISYHTI